MRLVAWNANCGNRKRRSFAQVLDLVAPLFPDVLVLSEGPADASTALWAWPEESPAKLAVWARPGFTVDVARCDTSIPQSALLRVRGSVEFSLVAAWPVEKPLSYAAILRRAVEEYLPYAPAERTILAGDLNSSTRVVAQRASHPILVSTLYDRGLTSVYHHHEGVAHGDERSGTFLRGAKEFCIDYAFVSSDLLDAASICIPRNRQWTSVSDHLPLIIDIPEAAFRRTGP